MSSPESTPGTGRTWTGPDTENDYSVIPKATNPNQSHFVSAAWHWTPSARWTNELLGGFNLTNGDFLNSQQFGPYILAGLFFSDPVNELQQQGRRTNTYQLADNAAYQRGRHFIQFGFHLDQVRVRSYFNDGIIPAYGLGMGLGQPALSRTDLPGSRLADVDVANALLATLGGYIDNYAQLFNVTSRTSGFVPGANNTRNFRLSEYDLYVQDQWKVSRRLTLTLGLRYDMPSPADERDALALLPVLKNNDVGANAALQRDARFRRRRGGPALVQPRLARLRAHRRIGLGRLRKRQDGVARRLLDQLRQRSVDCGAGKHGGSQFGPERHVGGFGAVRPDQHGLAQNSGAHVTRFP